MRPLLLLLTLCAPAAAQNVLVLVADDVGVHEVGTYGENPAAVDTPHLDQLAANGVLFRNFWSHPKCSPTRAAILTGQHAFRTGVGEVVLWQNGFLISPGWQTLPELMPDHATIAIGKWHLASLASGGFQHPVLFGFDEHRGSIKNLGASDSYDSWTKNLADATGNTQGTSTVYATTDNVDDALAFVEQAGPAPWFCWLAFNAGHPPWHTAPPHLHQVSPTDTIPRQFQSAVQAMDTEIGRLLAEIRPATLARTTVIYLGDNGPTAGATDPPVPVGFVKGSVYEGGVNAPLVIASPHVVRPGREVSALVSDVDLFPTILEAAGYAAPPSDGVSLMPLLQDPRPPPVRGWVYTERFAPNGGGPYTEQAWALRDHRYKLVSIDGEEQLFDLVTDPGEERDLLAAPLDDAQALALHRLRGIRANL